MDTVMIPVTKVRPYENNPRDNSESIAKVAESIRQFGFLQPIVCDGEGVILAGHTRYAAALSLGMSEVPVLYANELTASQARAYRLADNKVGESSVWLNDLLIGELEQLQIEDIAFDPSDFGFDTAALKRRKASWKTAAKKCGMNANITIRTKCGFLYTSFFSTGKNGRTLDEIKEERTLVRPFSDNLCDYLDKTLGGNLRGNGWCICTTPRRRHIDGFHFATAICETASADLGIPFHANITAAKNRGRLEPEFTMVSEPSEPNIILYDDIITTGITMRETRKLLIDAGHSVFPIAAIRNQ